MNLEKDHPPESADWLAPPEWTMEVQQEEDQSIIVVKRAGMQMCRLSVAPVVGDEVAVRHVLANKARHWIRDFLSRAAD
ncbi:hypothetical protein ACIPRI_16045 [Variovorax sp. LARHSF232]